MDRPESAYAAHGVMPRQIGLVLAGDVGEAFGVGIIRAPQVLVIGGLLGVGNEPKPEQEIMKMNERDEVSAVAGDLVGERGLADESVLPASCSGVPDAAAGPAGVALAGLSAGQVTGLMLRY